MSRPILRAQPAPSPYAGPRYTSARSSYPTFLSLPDTLKLQAGWAWRGLVDAFRWDIVVKLVLSDAEIRANALKSFVLNSISLLSIYVFDLLLHPLAKDQPQKWLHRNVGWFYQILWLLPVVGASLYLNASWCTLIANRTYTLHHGRASSYVGPGTSAAPNAYIAFLNSLATSAYRAVMVATSVVLSFALGYVPAVGGPAEFAFLCWVDAYYCFEFIWIARGLSLSRRVRHLEERWIYYFAFGFPSAALCMWSSTLASAALFALLFPSYIIMAMHSQPVPYDPYAPIPPSESSSGQRSIIHPSPYIPIRVPVFAPVIFINDCVVRVLSLGTRRRPAESTINVEEGEGDEIELNYKAGRRAPTLRQATRRKVD
ncbi:hypothetical protein BV25DRAFT_1992601 [Artomyces pyxidatus]|uniref:Uncharacterized protein n=1 Tax=Artomyces pyxidatus TaxID=48021 RepID=A0ACB8SWN6_9AGAM|nr:hypothetical protein BV25DRAFT_1992601 [Artomyces pyxidatus]